MHFFHGRREKHKHAVKAFTCMCTWEYLFSRLSEGSGQRPHTLARGGDHFCENRKRTAREAILSTAYFRAELGSAPPRRGRPFFAPRARALPPAVPRKWRRTQYRVVEATLGAIWTCL